MVLEAGRELLHYRLTGKLGEGGMGVVWKAVDTQLDREVAIKVLPDEFSQHPERLARFEREAKLLASLNHPGIAVIHGLHSEGNTRFLAMELVPGQDLSQRLTAGPLNVSESLLLCIQVAEALEAAHAQGVVHRDLKPANVLITPDGKAKVLDFGLAKAFEPDPSSSSGPSQSLSPTITSAGTAIGMILGTAAYMSPEQARGKTVDKRADIWAFGCLLYEALTAKGVFRGENVTDSMGAILHKEPDWSQLPAGTPPTVRLLLRRCLTKDPDRRLHDIADARIELEQAIADPESSMIGLAGDALAEAGARAASRARSRAVVLAAAALALGLIGGALAGRALQSAPKAELRKFDLGVSADPASGSEFETAISPDGTKVAFSLGGSLWVQDLTEIDAREIEDTAGAVSPFWSPDSKQVGYFLQDRLMRVAATGGRSSVITEFAEDMAGGRGAHWIEGGRVIFSRGNSGVLEVSARGGEPHELIAPGEDESDLHEPHVLPDGRGMLFVAHPRLKAPTTLVLYDDAGERRVLLHSERDRRIWSPLYADSGHILFRRVGEDVVDGLWALPFSLDSLEVEGEPFLVAADAGPGSVSRDGTLVFVHRPFDIGSEKMVWVDRSGKVLETVSDNRHGLLFPQHLSPDGTRLTFGMYDEESASFDAWIRDLSRGTETRITTDRSFEWGLEWLPGGEQIVYTTLNPTVGRAETWIVPADVTAAPRKLADGGMGGLSPDGKYVVVSRPVADQTGPVEDDDPLDIWIASVDGSEEPRALIEGGGRNEAGKVSPDGRYLAYVSNRSGRKELYLTRFPEGTGRWQVSVNSASAPRWSPSGDRLYYVEAERTLMAVEFRSGATPRLGNPIALFDLPALPFSPRPSIPSADGTRFLTADLAADPEDPMRRSIKVVQNWAREFED